MAKTAPRASFNWPLALTIMLLIVAVTAACVYWAGQQGMPGPVAEPADLISENRIVYGGMPRATAADAQFEVLANLAFIVGYSEMRKDALWSAYRVFHIAQPFNSPRPSRFSPDPRSAAHAKESDYTNSGYDRGHLAPNSAIAHCFGPEAQLETFLMTNVCPQSPALNERVWERLEVAERGYGDQLGEVWVIDGPIFGDLNGGVTYHLRAGENVPDSFYKIIIDEEEHAGGPPRVFCVIMPQDVKGTELPQQFVTSIREIEKRTHLDFLWKLDGATQERLETTVWPMW